MHKNCPKPPTSIPIDPHHHTPNHRGAARIEASANADLSSGQLGHGLQGPVWKKKRMGPRVG